MYFQQQTETDAIARLARGALEALRHSKSSATAAVTARMALAMGKHGPACRVLETMLTWLTNPHREHKPMVRDGVMMELVQWIASSQLLPHDQASALARQIGHAIEASLGIHLAMTESADVTWPHLQCLRWTHAMFASVVDRSMALSILTRHASRHQALTGTRAASLVLDWLAEFLSTVRCMQSPSVRCEVWQSVCAVLEAAVENTERCDQHDNHIIRSAVAMFLWKQRCLLESIPLDDVNAIQSKPCNQQTCATNRRATARLRNLLIILFDQPDCFSSSIHQVSGSYNDSNNNIHDRLVQVVGSEQGRADDIPSKWLTRLLARCGLQQCDVRFVCLSDPCRDAGPDEYGPAFFH